MDRLKSAGLRFIKGFVAGGLSSVAVLLPVSVGTDLKKFSLSILIAFISGGLLAIEKMINWTPTPPTDIPTSSSYTGGNLTQ